MLVQLQFYTVEKHLVALQLQQKENSPAKKQNGWFHKPIQYTCTVYATIYKQSTPLQKYICQNLACMKPSQHNEM